MTDDKGAGEGPYSVGKDMGATWWAVSDTDGVLWRHESRATAFLIKQVSNIAHAAGRKAERERCAKIVAEYDHECGMIDRDNVLEKIRGGQDGK